MEQVHTDRIQVMGLVEPMVVVQELQEKVTKSENCTYNVSIVDARVVQRSNAMR